ncbi:MAG: Rieske (2Fe-2S) protein [Hyphomonadaceae bacterium]|nr:Rieske (2Fe-2S) protein [Hyphomonadaceae bacterium]
MNPAQPESGARLASVDDVPDGGAGAFYFEQGEYRFSLLLSRRGQRIFAYENRCPHAGYPLERPDGRVVVHEQLYMVCTAHGASFVLDTGACAGGPCNKKGLTPIAVEVREGAVFMLPQDPCSDRGGGAS